MATSIFRANFPGALTIQQATDKSRFVIGLDLHKKTTAVCVFDRTSPDEPVLQRKRVPNARLLEVLQRFDGRKTVVCEAAYGWHLLRDALRGAADITFVPLDARKTAAWIASSGVKTDQIDAEVLCHVALLGGIPRLAVYVPEANARDNMQLVRHRDQMVRHRHRILMQLSVLDRDRGPNPYSGEVPTVSDAAATLHDDLQSALEAVQARIARLDAEMAHAASGDPIVALLRTIPGVGRITAFALRNKIGTIARFSDAAHLASYFGFGLRERQSGDNRVKGSIAKTGDSLVRSLLVQGAHIVLYKHPELVPLYFPHLGTSERLSDWRHKNKVVTALARKNLTFAYHVWKREAAFDLELYRARRLEASVNTPESVSVHSGG